MQERLPAFQPLRDLHDDTAPFVCIQGRIHGSRQRGDAHGRTLVGRVEKLRFARFQGLRGHGQVWMPDFRQPVFSGHPVEHIAIGRQLEKFKHQVRLLHG